jgi:hypothetical protein
VTARVLVPPMPARVSALAQGPPPSQPRVAMGAGIPAHMGPARGYTVARTSSVLPTRK